MIDHYAYQLALRAKAVSLSVATTGSTTLGASASGYTRAAGSFVTDGFYVGMEITASGFGSGVNNGAHTIKGVSTTLLTCDNCITEGAGPGRTIAAGLPTLRAWENVNFTPEGGRPYVVEQYIPGPTARETLGTLANLELTPMYALHVYVLANYGLAAAAIYADKLLALFAPGTVMTASNGDVIRVRNDVGPFRGQLTQQTPGWALVPVTIPLRVRTANTI